MHILYPVPKGADFQNKLHVEVKITTVSSKQQTLNFLHFKQLLFFTCTCPGDHYKIATKLYFRLDGHASKKEKKKKQPKYG